MEKSQLFIFFLSGNFQRHKMGFSKSPVSQGFYKGLITYLQSVNKVLSASNGEELLLL